MHRKVDGLVWAERTQARGGRPRLRGAKAQGLAFEQKVAKALSFGLHGAWFRYVDRNGLGLCSPDVVLLDEGVVLEVKLTWVEEAKGQLEELYLPVLGMVYQRKFVGVVVVKHMAPGAPEAVDSLGEAMRLARRGEVPVLQWLGRVPLVPRKRGA